jgi:hypothetical protein
MRNRLGTSGDCDPRRDREEFPNPGTPSTLPATANPQARPYLRRILHFTQLAAQFPLTGSA